MLDYNNIKIGIVDLKINNLHSIYNAFKKIGYKTKIIKNQSLKLSQYKKIKKKNNLNLINKSFLWKKKLF